MTWLRQRAPGQLPEKVSRHTIRLHVKADRQVISVLYNFNTAVANILQRTKHCKFAKMSTLQLLFNCSVKKLLNIEISSHFCLR